jgi:hypothetical protein
MANCLIHSAVKAVYSLYGQSYCEKCKKDMEEARKKVDKHVVPKECFIEYKGSKAGWGAIDGTGCAHWLAHQKNVKKGSAKCLAGFTLRVPDMVTGKSEVKLADVKVGDFYTKPGLAHIGVVISVTKPKKDGDPPDIMIENDSSAQGGVAKNSFATYFKKQGRFFR